MNKHERIINSLESVIKTLSKTLTPDILKDANNKLTGCIKELKGKEKKC